MHCFFDRKFVPYTPDYSYIHNPCCEHRHKEGHHHHKEGCECKFKFEIHQECPCREHKHEEHRDCRDNYLDRLCHCRGGKICPRCGFSPCRCHEREDKRLGGHERVHEFGECRREVCARCGCYPCRCSEGFCCRCNSRPCRCHDGCRENCKRDCPCSMQTGASCKIPYSCGIRVWVYSPMLKPLARIPVSITNSKNQIQLTCCTNASGKANFKGLPHGEYIVSVPHSLGIPADSNHLVYPIEITKNNCYPEIKIIDNSAPD